jgi:hypothetical protein
MPKNPSLSEVTSTIAEIASGPSAEMVQRVVIDSLLVGVGNWFPAAGGETKFPETVLAAAHHGCEGLSLDNQDALIKGNDKVNLLRLEVHVGNNDGGNCLRRQEFHRARQGDPLGGVFNRCTDINLDGGQFRLVKAKKTLNGWSAGL